MKNKTKKIRVWDIFKSAFETEMRRKEELPTDINYTITEKEFPDLKNHNIDAIQVFKIRWIVRKYDSIFAITCLNIYDEPVIVTDEFFELLPDIAKRFCIAHEIGHIINNEPKELEGKKFSIENEKRADEYAASIIGLENAIKSLESFIKITTPGVINRRVINERIDYLQQKIKK